MVHAFDKSKVNFLQQAQQSFALCRCQFRGFFDFKFARRLFSLRHQIEALGGGMQAYGTAIVGVRFAFNQVPRFQGLNQPHQIGR